MGLLSMIKCDRCPTKIEIPNYITPYNLGWGDWRYYDGDAPSWNIYTLCAHCNAYMKKEMEGMKYIKERQ